MNEAAFKSNLIECKKYLNDLNLLKKENAINIKKPTCKKYSEEFVRFSRKGTYLEAYRSALENDDYDFLLLDGSFFQFSLDLEDGVENVRMAFYPSVCSMQYEDFLVNELETTEEEVGAEYMDLYQQYLIEQVPKNVTPLRYDYNERLYDRLVHSAAHIHFGTDENVRVPTDKRIRPILFAKLVTEYYYFDLWKKQIKLGERDLFYCKLDYEDLEKSIFTSEDERIPFIHFHERH